MSRTCLLLCGLMLSALVGCGDAPPDNEAANTTPTDSNTPADNTQKPDEGSGDSTEPDQQLGMAAYAKGMCGNCHKPDGSGGERAPDLTDDVWEHCDGSVAGIRDVLTNGVAKGDLKDPSRPFGMNPATNLVPDQAELDALAEYVKSLSQ